MPTPRRRILSVIREMELPLLLLFNRGRLMVLPQGVCKGAGLRTALAALRLSVHNAIGIGDAENDHDLLAACEIGVAAGWGSKTLQASADRVLEGSGPAAVAGYLRRTMGELRLPARAHRTLPIVAGHFRRRFTAGISAAGTKCADSRRSALGKILGGGTGMRANDPAGLFGVRDRSGRRLPHAGTAARRGDHGWHRTNRHCQTSRRRCGIRT